jgi:hypothetical protein
MGDGMLDTLDNQDDTPLDDRLDAQRDIIRQALNEITNDVGMMLRDVGLTFPVYITVRNSKNSLATIAAPVDPSDTEWSSVSHRPQCYRQKKSAAQFARAHVALSSCELAANERGRSDCQVRRYVSDEAII